MRIEFDPTNRDEATAVRAVLDAMYPYGWTGSNIPLMQNREFTKEDFDWPEPTGEEIARGVERTIADIEKNTDLTPEVDSEGTPWDARIHSTPPTTNKDGTWRAKRGVKAEEIAAVRAEREAATPTIANPEEVFGEEGVVNVSAVELVSAPPAPPAPTGQSEAPLAPSASAESTASEAPSPPVTVTASTSGSATSASPSSPSFLDVMKAITAAQKDGKIDTAKVKELCAAVGAGESTMGLNGPDNGDKRGAFMALLGEVVS